MTVLNNSEFIKKSLELKHQDLEIDFHTDSTTDFQKHLLSELKKAPPKNFNEFIMLKINQMRGILDFDEYHLWFLFQMLICTADQTTDQIGKIDS